jgi:hypothetical protein
MKVTEVDVDPDSTFEEVPRRCIEKGYVYNPAADRQPNVHGHWLHLREMSKGEELLSNCNTGLEK